MTPAERLLAAAVRAGEDRGAGSRDAAIGAVYVAIAARLAAERDLPAPWPVDPAVAADVAELDVAGWDVNVLGALHEYLLTMDQRQRRGTWYTPIEAAEAVARLALDPQLQARTDPADPDRLLSVLACDPACGAGVFLVVSARIIAGRYAALLTNTDSPPSPGLVRAVMPSVLYDCVFGIDLDPNAVLLSKLTLWLETDGRMPITLLDGNIICGDTLNGDEPPRLAERYRTAQFTLADEQAAAGPGRVQAAGGAR
jgi:hypothetical protein